MTLHAGVDDTLDDGGLQHREPRCTRLTNKVIWNILHAVPVQFNKEFILVDGRKVKSHGLCHVQSVVLHACPQHAPGAPVLLLCRAGRRQGDGRGPA